MGRVTRTIRRLGLLAMLPLAACAPVPVPPPAPPPIAVVPVAPQPASPESQALKAYYGGVQRSLLAQGMLRTDGGGADTPFNDRMLADNFTRIALYDEYARTSGGLVARETESRLRRWDAPVRVAVNFGPSIPPERQAIDRARIGSYLARLARLTGHPIGLADSGANFNIWIVDEPERRALGPVIEAALPGLSPAEVSGLTELPRSTYCIVYAVSTGTGSTYSRAFAVVRAEHPDLLRLSCLHEEIAQGLGLANDSPAARPSIFNDDEEFALLTTQDEAMLRMLYDPRLRPGMTATEARPVIATIATALLGGDS